MWNLIYGSAQGTSHRWNGQPCQDYGIALVVATASGPVLIAACADGAGSADRSDVGARLAVETFIANVDNALAKGRLDPTAIDHDALRAWNAAARLRIETEAKFLGIDVRQLACTLLTAVVGPTSAAFSQIGDGAIVIDGPQGYEFMFWPDSGEYVNTTRFLTDSDFDRHVRFDRLHRTVRDIAILTDGLQMLALSYAEGRVHERFFKPMFEALRAASSGESLRASLDAFLDSERVNERTDDDKTLVLATYKPTTDNAPPCITATD
jgi:hypothetical protein